MATTIKRILPTRVAGNLGDVETYPDLDDAVGYLNFRNGETLSMAPTRAVPSSKYLNKNIRILLNEGQSTPSDIPASKRTMFAKNGCISDVNPNKGFNEFTPEECARVPVQLYNNKGGYGRIVGEAQENESKHKFQTDYADTQVKQVYQAITDFANANPSYGIINNGLIYATCSTIWWGKDNGNGVVANYQTVKDGLSSVSAARSLLAAFEWYFNRYWGRGLYETGAIPLINAYDVHNDNWLLYWKTVLVMELVAVANQGAFADPRTMSVFFWARAKELQPYTELYPIDLGGNLTLQIQEWPAPNPNTVLAMAGYAFEGGKHVDNWDNPYSFGNDPNVIPEAGGRINYNGSTSDRTIVNPFQASPYRAGVQYPYATAPFGYNDLVPIAGKMHCRRCDFINVRPTPIQFSFNGVNGPAPDAGYIPWLIDNHFPHIRVARDGNRAVFRGYCPDGTGGPVTFNPGGGFGNVTVDLWPNCDNQLHLQY